MTEHTRRLHAIVHGRVQGVNFRNTTTQTAHKLQLTGRVSNLPDGTVEVIAEGKQDTLQELVQFLHQGPPAARVERVDTKWLGATGEFEDFRIRYHGL